MEIADEVVEMKLPERGDLSRYNLNTLVTLGGIIIGIIVTSAGWGYAVSDFRSANANLQGQISDINSRMAQEAIDRKERLKSYQDQIGIMQQQIGQIPQISFQTTRALEGVADNKKEIEAANARFDRSMDSINHKIDTLLESVNKFGTQVQVLGSKIDDMQGKSDHTLFRTQAEKTTQQAVR